METKHTPTPWAASDMMPSLVFEDSQGCINLKKPVAQFKNAKYANIAVIAHNEQAALRHALSLAYAYIMALRGAGYCDEVRGVCEAALGEKEVAAVWKGKHAHYLNKQRAAQQKHRLAKARGGA